MFEIGDTVKCIDNSGFASLLIVGEKYVVSKVDVTGREEYIQLENKSGFTFSTWRFELLEKPVLPTFKVGDTVKCIDDSVIPGQIKILELGKIYTVISVYEDPKEYVILEDLDQHSWLSVRFVLSETKNSNDMPSNPKQIYGDFKVPLHLFPTTAIALGSMAILEGKEKYGKENFRASPIEAMTYIRACLSHLMSWYEGRDIDPDSGIDELGKALACIAIVIDAKYAGNLIDNRKFPGGFHTLMKNLEPHVKRIKEQHADKHPKDYTIADANINRSN